jgi:hypothetical protein
MNTYCTLKSQTGKKIGKSGIYFSNYSTPWGTVITQNSAFMGFAVSADNTLAILSSNLDGTYYSTSSTNGTSWSTFTKFSNVYSKDCRMTYDKSKFILAGNGSGGIVYFTIGGTTTAPSFTSTTINSVNRNYNGIGMSNDGSKLVVSELSTKNIYYTNWNGSSYNAITSYTLSQNTNNLETVTLSADGSKIYYSDSGNNFYFGTWSGTAASNLVKITTSSIGSGKIGLSLSNNFLFIVSTNKNYYSLWNGTSYGSFTEISSVSLPGVLYPINAGFHMNNNTVYLAPYGVSTVYKTSIYGVN